jgi:hypothetical protein
MSYDGQALVSRPIAEGSPDSAVVFATLKQAAAPSATVTAFRHVCRDVFGR